MQFLREDGSYLLLELPAKFCVTGPESYLASAKLGWAWCRYRDFTFRTIWIRDFSFRF